MRYEQVQAFGFGALAQGATLELAPGMTVVVGPNEAAKSTWHAALYAALCGRRRAKGRGRSEDLLFAQRHQPWDAAANAPWRVVGIVRLADGSRIQLDQELANGIKCTARELVLNRNLTSKLSSEGTPDGAQLVGLDRRSFASTASIRQAEVLSVLEGAGALQEHLQRAAATAGTDATAAAALQRLVAFTKDNVGRESRVSTKPLQRALIGVRAAEARLAEAQRLHQEYVELARTAELAEQDASKARRALSAAEEAFRVQQSAAAGARDAARAAVVEEAQRRIDEAGLVAAQASEVLETAATESREAITHLDSLVEAAFLDVLSARKASEAAEETAVEARNAAEHALRSQAKASGDLLVTEALMAVQKANEDREGARLLSQESYRAAEGRARDVAEAARELRVRAGEAFATLTGADAEAVEADARRLRAETDLESANRLVREAVDDVEKAKARLVMVGDISDEAGTSVSSPLETDQKSAKAAGAIQAWEERPRVLALTGPTSDALRAQLSSIPAMPQGDLEPDSEVVAAADALSEAGRRAQDHENRRHSAPTPPPAYAMEELEALIQQLSPNQRLIHDFARADPARSRAKVGSWVAITAVVLSLLMFLVVGPLGLGLLPVAAVAGIYSWRLHQQSLASRTRSEAQGTARDLAAERQEAARRRCDELDLPNDVEGLRRAAIRLGVEHAEAERARQASVEWSAVHDRLAGEWPTHVNRLGNALAARGAEVSDSGDLNVAFANYIARCRERAEQYRQASRRPDLEEALRHCLRAEGDIATARTSEAGALARLKSAAEVCGIDSWSEADPQQLIDGLLAWQAQRISDLAAEQERVQLWAKREQLLEGGTEEELARRVQTMDSILSRRRGELVDAEASFASLSAEAERATLVAADARTAHDAAQRAAEEADALRESTSKNPAGGDALRLADAEHESALRSHAAAVAEAAELVQRSTEGFREESLPEWAQAAESERQLEVAEKAHLAAQQEAKRGAGAVQQRLAELSQKAKDAAAGELEASQALAALLERLDVAQEKVADGCDDLRSQLRAANEEALQLRGSVEERGRHLIDVSECAEDLARARDEQQRVRDLEATLETTRSLLAQAQERVHKDIAPRINELVRKWLPTITDGRYVDCTVNPQTLSMTVYDRQREAFDVELLSRGTLEQIYLLLRVALAEIIATGDETCPLIIDDVTVHCDSERKLAVLNLLHALSVDRQIILFSQEAEVKAWAEDNLGESDKLVQLGYQGRPAEIPPQRGELAGGRQLVDQ